MTNAEMKAIEDAARSTLVWSSNSYDRDTRFGDIAKAMIPAMLILATATMLLLALL